jgi:hypothetical protein
MNQTKISSTQSKEQLWRKRLAEQAASGLSIIRWCQKYRHAQSLFHYWKRTLAKRDARIVVATRTQVAGSRAEQRVPFAQVVMAPPILSSAIHSSANGSPIEIVLSASCLVRVGAGFDARDLARVLDVLEARPC